MLDLLFTLGRSCRDRPVLNRAAMTTSTSQLHTLTVAGDAIEYTDSGGPGPTILLVHAGVFGAGFANLAASTALEGFRVVRMIRAGYTAGPAPTHHLMLGDHAAHAAALLEHLDIAHAHVVGHSSGSPIVIQLGLDRPELVDSLVLGEPPLIDPLVDPADLEFLHTAVGQVVGGAVAAANGGDVAGGFDAFMSVIGGPGYQEVLIEALGADGLARAERDSLYFFTDEVPAIMAWSFDATVAARLTTPVLLIQGGNSEGITHRLVTRVAGMLPHAEIATIDYDDHLFPQRNPDTLGQFVAQFVRRHTSDAGLEVAIERTVAAGRRFVNGDPTAFAALWSDGDDVTIFGGFGSGERGRDEIVARLAWASARFGSGEFEYEPIASGSSGELGYAVGIERGRATLVGCEEPGEMVLRVTHLFRHQDGEWKLIHRHADAVASVTPPAALLAAATEGDGR
jgi:pimeloyl-ACP methyl ester carboxylesterase/ketosteroid isomerase-like protein